MYLPPQWVTWLTQVINKCLVFTIYADSIFFRAFIIAVFKDFKLAWLAAFPITEILRIENRTGRRPEVLWPEVGHLGFLESLNFSGCMSWCTILLEDITVLKKLLCQSGKNFGIWELLQPFGIDFHNRFGKDWGDTGGPWSNPPRTTRDAGYLVVVWYFTLSWTPQPGVAKKPVCWWLATVSTMKFLLSEKVFINLLMDFVQFS